MSSFLTLLFLTNIQFHDNHTPWKYGVQFRIAQHSNKTLFWHEATTYAVFSLMTGL